MPKILLVEDEILIRDLYSVTLESKGFEVEVAGRAEECYAKVKSFKPDIVFLDILLPGQSGMEILKALRSDPANQSVRIVMLTNLAQEELTKEATRNHADGYIVKADINIDDLPHIIEEVSRDNQPLEDVTK
jgi:DNA-binding response OmpR family regulator